MGPICPASLKLSVIILNVVVPNKPALVLVQDFNVKTFDRKEQLNPDGSVTGSFGWVDPNGILRLTDYVSDAGGYRIEKERLFKVK